MAFLQVQARQVDKQGHILRHTPRHHDNPPTLAATGKVSNSHMHLLLCATPCAAAVASCRSNPSTDTGPTNTTAAHLVLRASRHLKITVDVGLVVGTIPAIIPMGSAIFWMPSCKSKKQQLHSSAHCKIPQSPSETTMCYHWPDHAQRCRDWFACCDTS
jgi:hypothetical protein